MPAPGPVPYTVPWASTVKGPAVQARSSVTMPRFKAHIRDGRRKLADLEVDVRTPASSQLCRASCGALPAALLAPHAVH